MSTHLEISGEPAHVLNGIHSAPSVDALVVICGADQMHHMLGAENLTASAAANRRRRRRGATHVSIAKLFFPRMGAAPITVPLVSSPKRSCIFLVLVGWILAVHKARHQQPQELVLRRARVLKLVYEYMPDLPVKALEHRGLRLQEAHSAKQQVAEVHL